MSLDRCDQLDDCASECQRRREGITGPNLVDHGVLAEAAELSARLRVLANRFRA